VKALILALVLALVPATVQAANFEDVLPDLRVGSPVAMDSNPWECLSLSPFPLPGGIVFCGLGVPNPNCPPWGWCCIPWDPYPATLYYDLLFASDWSVIESCPPMLP
jgi:hypothetical protein